MQHSPSHIPWLSSDTKWSCRGVWQVQGVRSTLFQNSKCFCRSHCFLWQLTSYHWVCEVLSCTAFFTFLSINMYQILSQLVTQRDAFVQHHYISFFGVFQSPGDRTRAQNQKAEPESRTSWAFISFFYRLVICEYWLGTTNISISSH